MESIVQDHERRIVELEKNTNELKNGMLRVENAVLQEGNQQRKKMDAIHDQLFNHFFDERTDERGHKAKLAEIRWTTIAGILTGGTAVTLGVQWILDKL